MDLVIIDVQQDFVDPKKTDLLFTVVKGRNPLTQRFSTVSHICYSDCDCRDSEKLKNFKLNPAFWTKGVENDTK